MSSSQTGFGYLFERWAEYYGNDAVEGAAYALSDDFLSTLQRLQVMTPDEGVARSFGSVVCSELARREALVASAMTQIMEPGDFYE
jgi:hypothetical protein